MKISVGEILGFITTKDYYFFYTYLEYFTSVGFAFIIHAGLIHAQRDAVE